MSAVQSTNDASSGDRHRLLSKDSESAQAAPQNVSALNRPFASDVADVFAFAETAVVNARSSGGGLAPWKLKRLAQHVECNLHRNLEAKELAKLAGLSVCHFAREFRRTVGVPPHRYVIYKRIDYAKRLIANTNHSIIDIAAECGFADQPHLTTLFKRFVGETPAAWRRSQRDGSKADSTRSRGASDELHGDNRWYTASYRAAASGCHSTPLATSFRVSK
jgi:AraC family transcriptional regulator